MKSRLNIVIRDPSHPCNPYSATPHTFTVGVFNCDMSLFTAELLTGVGPGGGRIYGEVEVPAGAYIVVGISTCKNVWTNWAMVVVGCGQHVCVNLLPRKFEMCVQELRDAILEAVGEELYSFSSSPQQVSEDMRKALEQTRDSLEALSEYLPKYELPVSVDALAKAGAPEELLHLWRELQEVRGKR